jgi:hypothetical protein
MLSERARRRICVCSAPVLLFSVVGVQAGADVQGSDASAPMCPDGESVWATVSKLVPEAAPRLLSAKPNIRIDDFGDHYRVRVRTAAETIERDYTDSARDCGRRARFAAEFIVLALLPPHMAEGATPSPATAPSAEPAPPPPSAGEATPGSPAPLAPPPAPPGPPEASASPPAPLAPPSAPLTPSTSAPPPAIAPDAESPPPGSISSPSFFRVELSAASSYSPPIREAPSVLSWGAEVRARLGAGRFAGIVGASYWPQQVFHAGDLTGAVTRVPAVAGIRVQALRTGVELDADLALSVAFEQYAGKSPLSPADATRVTPGSEATIAACLAPAAGFAPFLAVQISWFPVAQEIVVLPEALGKAPSLWVALALGVSYTH